MNENDQRSVIEYTARLASRVAPHALKLSGKTIQFIGAEPFAVDDLQGLLPSDATVVIDEAVDARHEGTSFLPHDGFLDLVLFGYDWWTDHVNLLNRSRDSHPGMSYLHSLQSFRWPGTEAPESLGTTDSEGEFKSETDLLKLGYKISGMSRPERWLILSAVAVPRLGLEEVTRTIANHIRLRKTQVGGADKYSYGIGEWEHDLARLRSTYYLGSAADFYWPSTGR